MQNKKYFEESCAGNHPVIGIIGGGQLGKMISAAASRLGFKTSIFSNDANSCATYVTNSSVISDYSDIDAIKKFCSSCDIITFEFENIPLECIKVAESLCKTYPASKVLSVSQNRLSEKNFFKSLSIETVEFAQINSLLELEEKLSLEKFRNSILKTTTNGYDGKGQFRIVNSYVHDRESVIKILNSGADLILESKCDFEQEISVLTARNERGETATYNPITNIHKNGILDKSIYPANVGQETSNNARKIAEKIAESLDLVGVLVVEFFVTKDGKLLVNEIAPRPHNSYHFSIDAAITCQFEQLIRAITAMPLGSTKFHSEGYMKNLVGEEISLAINALKEENAKVHVYCKGDVKVGRKMGHINFISHSS